MAIWLILTMPVKTREASIELLRVLLMFGICFLHSVSAGPLNRAWVANVFMPCVGGFAFISGWFGIRFSARKIMLLYLTVFWTPRRWLCAKLKRK